MATKNKIEVPTCPMCGSEYPDRPADEGEYECTQCGSIGFDCCVPGNNSICTDCEDKAADPEAIP